MSKLFIPTLEMAHPVHYLDSHSTHFLLLKLKKKRAVAAPPAERNCHSSGTNSRTRNSVGREPLMTQLQSYIEPHVFYCKQYARSMGSHMSHLQWHSSNVYMIVLYNVHNLVFVLPVFGKLMRR